LIKVLQADKVGFNFVAASPQAKLDARPWWRGFELLATLPVITPLLLASDWPRWMVMWLICGAIYAGCKWLTWRRSRVVIATWARQLGYLFAWSGLDADRFLKPAATAMKRPLPGEWLFAAVKFIFGVVLIFYVARWIPADDPLVRGWIGMLGIIFTLHFGLFHLLSCAWRAAGVDAAPLMNWPVLATSLSDFWGRRWNAAFRDLTHPFLFRPLLPRCEAVGALFAVFVLSGLIHELAITLPARGGFGGPTCYFLLQACGLMVERSTTGKALGLAHGWRGWLFSMLLLVLPLSLLFPPVFVRELIAPMMQAIGAL
jgi:hypothetical protein